MNLRDRVHGATRRHHRRMERAGVYAAVSMLLRDKGEFYEGWTYVQRTIGEVVRCGCDRELWPLVVREVVKGG